MKGAIIINGYYKGNAYLHQIHRIRHEFALKGKQLSIIKNNKSFEPNQAFDLDFAIFLDKDKYLAMILEQQGVILFNNASAIEHCDDKITTAIDLTKIEGICSPKTVIAPIKYRKHIDKEFVEHLETKLAYPMVAKKAMSSLGEGIKLVQDSKELVNIEYEWSTIPHMYQSFVARSRGKSIRTYVVGHKVIAGMLTENKADFRSNMPGAERSKIDLDATYIDISKRISRFYKLDFCAVDFCVGGPLVLEVNSNAFFEEMEKATAVNIAGHIADYIILSMRENIK